MQICRYLSSRSLMTKVLFCGRDFPTSFLFTKEALLNVPGVVTIQCERQDLEQELADATIFIPFMTKIGKHELSIAKNLQMIMQYGVGLEGVDIDAATASGVWVCNIESEGTGNAQSCAEHAIYLALSCLRNPSEMAKSLKMNRIGFPMGRTLYKGCAVVYGYGGIGKQLVQRLKYFDMNITVVVRNQIDLDTNILDNVKFITADQFHSASDGEINCDVLFLCCSQNKDNFGLVNSSFLAKLKSGLIIINVARGGLLNYADIYDGLCSGTIGGLGIDVFHTEPFPVDDEVLLHPNVIASPHIAGVTEISYRNMAQKVADNVCRIIRNEPPIGNVNIIPTK